MTCTTRNCLLTQRGVTENAPHGAEMSTGPPAALWKTAGASPVGGGGPGRRPLPLLTSCQGHAARSATAAGTAGHHRAQHPPSLRRQVQGPSQTGRAARPSRGLGEALQDLGLAAEFARDERTAARGRTGPAGSPASAPRHRRGRPTPGGCPARGASRRPPTRAADRRRSPWARRRAAYGCGPPWRPSRRHPPAPCARRRAGRPSPRRSRSTPRAGAAAPGPPRPPAAEDSGPDRRPRSPPDHARRHERSAPADSSTPPRSVHRSLARRGALRFPLPRTASDG